MSHSNTAGPSSSASHSASDSTSNSRRARINLGHGEVWQGHVTNNTFVVEDKLHNGVSHFALTHHAPAMNPIPLAALKQKGVKVEYL